MIMREHKGQLARRRSTMVYANLSSDSTRTDETLPVSDLMHDAFETIESCKCKEGCEKCV